MRPDISPAISRRPLALATSKGNKPATAAGLDDQHHGPDLVTACSRPAAAIGTQGLPVEPQRTGDRGRAR